MTGCVSWRGGHETRRQSSTVSFLYPKAKDMTVSPGIPHLTLPLDVGIAFVPESGKWNPTSEEQKAVLLKSVAERFANQPFIRKITIIPTAYLRPDGGFANLDQIQSMMGVDVIALVAYDQIQHTDEGLLSLAYWTIVGAYVVNSEKNDTSTMMDTAVFHIPSRKMLFRAPGTSQIKARSTYVNWSEQMRKNAREGLTRANEEMIQNLELELNRFKIRVKEKPEEVRITRSPGYTGGGSHAGWFGLLLILLISAAWRPARGLRE